MTIYGRRIGTSCSRVPNGNIVCVERSDESARAATSAGCVDVGSVCNPGGSSTEEMLFGMTYCCPLNVARDQVAAVGSRPAVNLPDIQTRENPFEQQTTQQTPVVERVTQWFGETFSPTVDAVKSGVQDAISQVSSKGQPADQSGSKGQTAPQQPQTSKGESVQTTEPQESYTPEPAQASIFSSPWVMVLGGVLIVGVGLGFYFMRRAE